MVCYIDIDSQNIKEAADTKSQSGKCRRWILTYLGSNPSLIYYWVAFSMEKAMATHSSTLAWKIPGMAGNISNLRYADDTTLMAESKEELKSLLMKVKKESEKPGLNIQKTKIMASGPITS